MTDGCPFLVPSKRAILCLSEKVGSTTWKFALLRAQPAAWRYHDLDYSPHIKPPSGTSADEFAAAVAKSAAPRFMLVRNPYSRFLSAYLDKVRLQNKTALWPRRFRDGLDHSFAALINATCAPGVKDVDRHFLPLSRSCLMSKPGAAPSHPYDFFLKVEQIERWYLPFVRAIGLESTVKHGWNASTYWWHSQRDCFYAPAGVTCAVFHKLDSATAASAAPPAQGTSMPASFHATGADSQLNTYYTPKLAEAVTRCAENDLAIFGYPRWNGVDGLAYLRRLRLG
mmetsp:Transcript_7201/g.12132  ORF Transcript_7201/g.12132 Transcript_7201/m.12132 type:complete len:283 (+) Transcript_7201:182-1030(+)